MYNKSYHFYLLFILTCEKAVLGAYDPGDIHNGEDVKMEEVYDAKSPKPKYYDFEYTGLGAYDATDTKGGEDVKIEKVYDAKSPEPKYYDFEYTGLGAYDATDTKGREDEKKETYPVKSPRFYHTLYNTPKTKDDRYKVTILLPDFLERKLAQAIYKMDLKESQPKKNQTKKYIEKVQLYDDLTLYLRKNILTNLPKDRWGHFRFEEPKEKKWKTFLIGKFGETYHTFCSHKYITRDSRRVFKFSVNNSKDFKPGRLSFGSLLPKHYQFLDHFYTHHYCKTLALYQITNLNVDLTRAGKICIFVFGNTGDDSKSYLANYRTYMYEHHKTTFKNLFDFCNKKFDETQIKKIRYFVDKEKHIGDKKFEKKDVLFEYSQDAAQRAETLSMAEISWEKFGEKAESCKKSIQSQYKFKFAASSFLLFLFGDCIKHA